MRYILSMISNYSDWQAMTPEQAQAFDAKITAFNDDLRKAGAWVSAEGLGEPSEGKTVRFEDGNASVGDGPYVDRPDQFGGFWIIEAATIDEAVEWARKAPLTRGAIEVRQLV
jgi:hypothetical protein